MLDAQSVVGGALTGTRVFDAAKGVLVGLRRITMAEAFAEILAVATEYEVGVLALSRALVEMAEGQHAGHSNAAEEAAHRAWASLLDHP